jgi:hypothetical protein
MGFSVLALFPYLNMIDFDLYKKNVEQMRSAIFAIGKHAHTGFKNVCSETYNTRKMICGSCEFWKSDGWGGLGKCEKCGCSGIKLKFSSSTCPMGHWGEERIDTPST